MASLYIINYRAPPLRQNEFITKGTLCQLLKTVEKAVTMLNLSKLSTLCWRLSLLAFIGPAVVKAQSATVVRDHPSIPSEGRKEKGEKEKKNIILLVEVRDLFG